MTTPELFGVNGDGEAGQGARDDANSHLHRKEQANNERDPCAAREFAIALRGVRRWMSHRRNPIVAIVIGILYAIAGILTWIWR